MKLITQSPKQSLNKAYLKQRPLRSQMDVFKSGLIGLLDKIDEKESEEFHKNLVSDFLKKTIYQEEYFINTKGRQDLVIHNGKDNKTQVGVILEAKRPNNKADWFTPDKPNGKAIHELVLYYLRERIEANNIDLKYLVATNINEWYIIEASYFEKLFYKNKAFVKHYEEWRDGQKVTKDTALFYNDIVRPFIDELNEEIPCTYFNIHDYEKVLRNADQEDDKNLIALLKILSPNHLLKVPFANDSNSLDKRFYIELLHIIGLTEVKDGGKKLIERNKPGERHSGTLLESATVQLDSLDKLSRLEKPSQFGNTLEERYFNVGLELCITWINRILFLKLMEAQLIAYHKGDKSYTFLTTEKIKNYDDLNSLFFQVLARQFKDRNEDVKKIFEKVPYLNSSLFEPTDLEQATLVISNLKDDKEIPVYSQTVLKDKTGKKRTEGITALEYLFEFLNAYDFSGEGSEEVQEDNKTLINASVLGLIFEKINGYKDGSFFTPGFITMYMCRETIRKAVVQKFNEAKNWNLEKFEDIYDKIEDRNEANEIVNSLKICDPAVGSGHFLVSALNEIISVKNDLKILSDRTGKRLKEYHVEVVNDELVVTDEEGDLFEYNPSNKESQRIQETLFHEKETIIEKCLFGVDINPNSVKICRLRLWIELLKSAYYKSSTELETLPNIDINIKCGNSLVSRFAIDSDLKQALKKSKWSIDSYRLAVDTYRNAESKEQKREMERLINDIKSDFRSEISTNDPKVLKLRKLSGELFQLTNQQQLFEMSKKEKAAWNKKVQDLTIETKKLEAEIEEIKANKIFENAFEWRFEFPEVLNDDGDFVGFDVVIGNPPYLQLSKTEDITESYKKYLLDKYQTSGGRLNTFIFFIHHSNNILRKNGILNFIIPNTILSQEYYSFTRDFLINKVSLTEIVKFPLLPFDDAVVETVLIQYINGNGLQVNFPVKELSNQGVILNSKLNKEVINKDSKYSFLYNLDPVIEKVIEFDHVKFGSICEINQGIALKGDKSLSLKTNWENENYFKLLDGRNINKYLIKWNGVYLDYDLERIHSCKRQDIFESKEKLLFRRVSSSLIFTYDDEQYYALNTLVIVNKIDYQIGPSLKFILGLMNSKLMNYIYVNKFKSTKTVFSEIQARSVKELPIPIVSRDFELDLVVLVEKILISKKQNKNTVDIENQIDQLVYQLYNFTEEEIKIIEDSIK